MDARNTANDPVLLGPPSLEFAPYAKIPSGRARKDARQGTIDQDPEFISFLESLTQPVAKPGPEATTDGEEKKEAITTTPLVQYIREKKANRAKESAAAKAAKQAKADKESKSDKAQAKKLLQRADKEGQPTGERGEKKSKSGKATKEAVKAANKQAASVAKQAARTSAPNTPKDSPPTGPAADRKKERGNAAAAAKILQRDLGLAASGGRRKGGKSTSTDTESAKEEQAEAGKEASPKPGRGKGKGSTTPQAPEALSPPSDGGTPRTGTPPGQGKPPKPAKGKQGPIGVTPTATQAFLKHANPSQGVTETLLDAAFAPFGKVDKVEIDRKKGFGYIDFAEPDGLHKAIAASPVTVAESQVVVLERRVNPEKKGGNKAGESRGRRGPRKGRSGNGGSEEKEGSRPSRTRYH